ncbi:MAG: PAS domain-containing sensor histidine kinase, partial [Deltaproteobacteria bacterium]|nr:PAS domain-containing sensor histidine kinase [Deltaproteobacteria bacterium]
MSRPALHNRLFLVALLAGLPSLVVALVTLRPVIAGPLYYGMAATALAASLLGGALFLRYRLVYRLRSAANLATALRQGDLSIRARRGSRDGAFGSMILELNSLAEALREQRLDELEAVSLLRNVLGEIDVAVFAFDGEHRLRMLNGAGERLLGMTAEAAMDREAEELGLADCLTGEPERTLSLDVPGGEGRWELR